MNHVKRVGALFTAFCALAATAFGGAGVALAANSNSSVVPDQVQRGGVAVVKYDAETKDCTKPQGGADLAGAEFTITNNSDHPIVFADENGKKTTYMVGESWVIQTKKVTDSSSPFYGKYVAATSAKALPYGTYHIQETKGSPGYGLATKANYLNHKYVPGYVTAKMREWVDTGYDFTISADNQFVTFDGENTATKTSDESGASYTAGPGAYNPLIRGGIEALKRDHDLLRATAQGNAGLEGGTFVIYNYNDYAVQVWDHFDQQSTAPDSPAGNHGPAQQTYHGVVAENYEVTLRSGEKVATEMDENGWVKPGGIVAIIQTGDDGRAQTFMDALPVGWYTIVEREAPIGYVREERWQSYVEVTDDDWDALVVTDCDDPVLRGAAQIQKFDATLLADGTYAFAAGESQGDGALKDAHIEIYNNSNKDVWIREADFTDSARGVSYNTGDVSGISGRVGPGEKVAEIVTNEQGIATIKGLPYGSYYAIEKASSYGYKLNADWRWDFEIKDSALGSCDADGQQVVAKADGPEKGAEPGDEQGLPQGTKPTEKPAEIWKIDAETGKPISLVDGLPFDMSFEVINASRSAVVFEGKRYEVGASLGIFDTDTDTGRVYFDGEGDDGHYGLLPAGTYRVKEARAPEGYIKSTEVFTLTVVDNGEALTSEGFEFVDKVIREDIQFQKVDADNMKPLSGIPFLLEKLDKDGNVMESHILVTDEDGMVDTSGDLSGYQGWRARMKDGQPHYNLADQYYDTTTGEFTYVAPYADKAAVLAELNGDGTAENPGLIAELSKLMSDLDELMTKANVAGIQSLYDELVQIIRDLNTIAAEQGDDSAEYAAKVAEQADKIVEIHEAIAAAKAAAGDDYLEQIDALEAAIIVKEAEIKDAQQRLAAIDDELSGSTAIWETGYWFFGGEQGDGIEPNEVDGALPYGDYRLTELRCAANTGYDLVSREVHIKRGNGLVENYGTIDNKPYPDCDPCADVSVHGLDVDMHKDSNPAPNSVVKPGSDITYTLSYENTSAEKVPYLLVRDAIPESTTFKSADNDGVFVEDKGAVEWVITDVEPGQTGTVSFTVTVNKGARSIITNQARFGTYKTEIVAGENDENPIGSTNIVKHSTDGTKTGSYLSAVKRSEPAPGSTVKIGDQIKYFVDVTNKGDTDMEAVAVVDTIPVGTKLATGVDENYYDVDAISDGGYRIGNDMVGWNIGTLKAGETKTVSFTVDVTEDVRYSVSNQATFGASRAQCTGLLDNTTNIVTHKVETLPELTITKSCDRDRTTTHGEILTYTLHIENNGRGNAINVPVYDIIPEGTQYVMGSISTDVHADESHTYPFTSVEGEGAADATELVEAKPYVNWTIPVLYNRGGYIDLTYQVRVRDDVAVGDIIQNRATVGGEGPLSVDTEEPTVTTDVTVPAVSNLIEHEVVDAADDVEVIKTADPVDGSSVAPGDEITYTVTATNNGEHSVHGFGIRDAIPEHTTFVDGSIVVVGADGKSSTEIAEEAQQQTQEGDECGTVPDDVSIVWTPEAMLNVGNMNEADAEGIYKIVVPNEEQYKIYSWGTIKRALTHLGVGESIEFEVTSTDGYNLYWRATYMEDGRLLLWKRVLVPNATDSVNYTRANGVYANYDQKWRDVYAITDELKPGETITLTFTVKVDDDVEDNTEIHNVATYGHGVYSAPCFDLDHESNTTTHVVGTPHLVAEKTVDKADARRGDVLTYTVTITNDGTARAKDVAIHDEFRAASALNGLTYVVGSWNVSGGDAAQASEQMASEFDASTRFVAARCNTLEPGETLTMTFQCLVADAVDGDVITNKATWEANHEGNPLYGDLSEETNEVSTLIGEPKLSIEKTADPDSGTTVEVGDTITYTFKVTNDSSVYTNNAAVFDMIPTYTTLVEGSLTGGLEVVRGEDIETTNEAGETVSEPGPIIGVGLGGIHLDSGESREFSFKVSVDPSLVEDVTISNVATAGFSDDTPSMPLQTASNTTVNDAVAPDTELRIVKSADPAGGTELNVGDVITYTIVALNESTTPAKDVCVFDYIPDHTSFVKGSATGGLKYVESGLEGGKPAVVASGLTLGANERVEMTFQVKVDDTLDDLLVSNRATIGEFRGNPTAPLDIDSNEVISNVIAPKPAISITDFADPESGTQVKAGDVITYTFKVTETEGVPAEGIAVFDYVPANTTFIEGSETGGLKAIKNSAGTVVALYADGISLAANGSAEFSFQVEVGNVPTDTEIANQPTAGFADEPKLPLAQVGETMTHNIIAEKPVLRLTKTATPGAGTAVSAGDVIDYSFTVSNDSEALARGVAVFDRVPANTTYVAGSAEGLKELTDESGNVYALYADNITLAAHRSRTFGFAVTVGEGEDIIVSNRATAGFAEAPTTDLELDSNEVVHGAAAPDVRVTKAATPGAGTAIEPGDVITYDITVKNASTGADRNVQVYDKIPAGTTYVDGSLIATGATKAEFADGAIAARYDKVEGKGTYHIIFKVTVNDEFSGNIANVATFGHGEGLPTGELPEATNPTTNVSVAKAPQLRITQVSDPVNGTSVAKGDEITYTITVKNEGEGAAHGVAIFDRLPEHTEFVSGDGVDFADGAVKTSGLDIAPGESETVAFTVRVVDGGDVIVSNRATTGFATDPTTDLELDSNEIVHGVATPDVKVTKTSDAGETVRTGDVITYSIKVTNAGNGVAENVGIHDLIPAGTTYVEGSLKAASATESAFADGAIAARYAKLAPGRSGTITFKVTVDAGKSGIIANEATYGFATELPSAPLTDFTNQVITTAEADLPQLRITKSANPGAGVALSVGDEITYTISVSNDGEGMAHGVAVFDRIPEHTSFVAGSAQGLELTESGDAVFADGIELEAHETKTFIFKVRVEDEGVIISNRATTGFAEAPTTDLELDSNEVVNAAEAPNTEIDITSDPANGATVTEGSDITYTVRVKNSGRGADRDVAVYAPIPDGTAYVEGSLVANGAESIAQTTDGTVTGIAAHYDTVAPNSTSVITFKVRVMGTAGATVDEKATMGHMAELPTAALETESNQVSHILDKAPVLSIVKSQDPGSGAWVAGGDTLTYSIKVTNEGNTIARKVGVYDEAPEHTKYVAGSLSTDRGEVYEGSDGLLTNIAGDLMPGESVTMTFKVKIDLGFVGTIYNRAMWVSPAADPETVDAGNADADASGATQADVTSPDAASAAEGGAAPAAAVVPSTRLLGVLGATVPIPEGSYSGISNEVTAGGAGSDTPSDPTPSDPAPVDPTPSDPTPAPSDPTPSGEPGSNEVNAGVKAPEVKITKTATPAGTVKAGSTITYTIRMENTGDVNANSLYMRDVMPSGITFKAGTVTVSGMTYEVKDGNVIGRCSLKPGEVATVSFQATVGNDFSGDIVNVAEWGQAEDGKEPTEMLGSSKVTNTAQVDELGGDSNEVNAYVNKPTIQLVKTSDPEDGSIVKPGTKVTYTLTATNVGRVNANDLYILDEIPEGLTVDAESVKGEGLVATFADGKLVARGSLRPTESGTVTFEATVGKDFVGDIMNQAKWGQADEGEEPETFEGNSNEDLIHVGTTEVELIKSCDHADGTFVSRGAKLVYTIEAENKGTLDVDMTITDKVPEGTTFESFETVDGKGEITSDPDGTITFKPGVLKHGEKAAFKFTVTVDADAIGDIRNVANWTDGGENSGESNSIINHVSDPKISVTKTNDAESGKVRPGETVSYVISVTNSGTTKGLVRVTDEIPAGLALDKDSVRVTTNSIVDDIVMDDTQDDADAVTDDQQPADAQQGDVDGASADAADAVADAVASDAASGKDEISVEVKDNSPFGALASAFTNFVDWITGAESDEAGIIVDDASIKGAFYIAPNQTVAITYEAKVADDAELGKAITNVVNAEVEGGDPSHSESVVTPGAPNVTMTKSTDVKTGASVKVGDTITYSINVTNSGTATSDIITMTDTIPEKTSYVAGSAKLEGEGGSLAAVAEENLVTKDASGKVTGVAFEVGRLEPGETSATLSFQVKVDETGEISDIENVAHWTAVADPDDPKPTDPEPSNPIVTPVEPTKPDTKGPKLEIKKIGIDSNGKETSSFKSGSTQDWKITVTNSGDEAATNVSVKDLFGDGLTFVKATEGNRTLSAEVTGHASAASAYASKIAASAKALQNSDGTYSVGVSSFKDGYLYGSATEGVSANNYATAIPSGTYEVTIASGFRGALQIIAMDDSGKVITNAGAQGTLGYSTSADKLTVTIPENGRLVLTCQKNANNTWTDANTSEHAWTFKPTGATKLPETSTSGEYSAKFVIDKIEAGKSVTITVTTKTSADAPSKVTNTAKAYLGASDKDAVTSSATLNRSDYSEPKKTDNTENLPKTAATIVGLLVVAVGVGALGYGIVKLRRKDEDVDEGDAGEKPAA